MISDQRRFKQILINLLTNAVKFTFHGGITLNIHSKVEEDRELIICQVLDTGMGIPKENICHLFKPFSMLTQHQNVNPSGDYIYIYIYVLYTYIGTGLGLNLCKQLVEKMGGEIWCKSERIRIFILHFIGNVDWQHKSKPPF